MNDKFSSFIERRIHIECMNIVDKICTDYPHIQKRDLILNGSIRAIVPLKVHKIKKN